MHISIRALDFDYPSGVSALRGVSLEIAAGERVAIIGQNGSGKTTLAKHLNGLLKPTRGSVCIGEWDTRTHSVAQLARRVGFAFQNPEQQIFKSVVAEEVAFGPRNLKLADAEVDARVSAALAQTGLSELRDAHPYELLPSHRKWVGIASVLAMNTPIVVLDEPTTGQDAHGLARLGALLESLTRAGKTLVAITHDIDFCAEQFARVVVLSQGQVIADGDKHAVFAQHDLLAQTFIEPPQLTRLASALALEQTVTTQAEFLAALAEKKQGDR